MKRLLAGMELKVQPEPYAIVSIDREEEEKAKAAVGELSPFSSLTLDHAEASMVVKTGEWRGIRDGFKRYEEEGPYRLITFDMVLDLSLVGFMAIISARLAEAGVSIYALSTYLRDHILVREGDLEKAIGALQGLIEECKEG